MIFPALIYKKTYRRGARVFYIFTLANIYPDPIAGGGSHILGVRRVFTPDGNEVSAAGLRQIGSFGGITENSLIDVIFPIDTKARPFTSSGVYTLEFGQNIDSKWDSNVVVVKVRVR